MTKVSTALPAFCCAFLLFGAFPSFADGLQTLKGACDGSAGVAIDDSHFVVADDDSNELLVFADGADTGKAVDLTEFLGVAKKKNKPGYKEADLEGAARVGDRIYWIASHARDSEGKADDNRTRFFATTIGPGPSVVHVADAPFRDLRKYLVEDPRFGALAKAYGGDAAKEGPLPESPEGFNIEGLAADAQGRLLIGFRNPRPNGAALLVPLNNPKEVVETLARPEFGDPIPLDLEGRGVRSIERVGDRFLILAGPYGDVPDAPKPAFQIRAWSGKPGDVHTTPLLAPEVLDGKLGPEALFALPGGKDVMILYDEGDRIDANGQSCKKLAKEQQSFRARRIPLSELGK